MKFVNPLEYPIAVLAASLLFVAGIRTAGPKATVVALPVAIAVSAIGATWLQSRKLDTHAIAARKSQRELQAELQQVRTSADSLATKAEQLRQEAERLLAAGSSQLELLAAVQYTCDRAVELPAKIDDLARRIEGGNTLLSIAELQQQLNEVRSKQDRSSGVARQSLARLVERLEQNIQLAREGKDAGQAQIVTLATTIQESAGVLQRLQNKLRTSDLQDSDRLQELRDLNEELRGLQESARLSV